MTALWTIAGKEIRVGLRNRWIIAATGLMAVLALSLALLGSAPTGSVGLGTLTVTVVSLSSLTIFLVPLIALMLSYDAVVGEMERGTMLLLLAYPVSRWQIVIGKFLGHTAILAVATGLGYGVAGLVAGLNAEATEIEDWAAFAALVGSSIALGAAFLAIGYLLSVIARERAVAAGLSVAIWLVVVIVYDLALLGVLVMDQGQIIGEGLFQALLLLNPADAFRLFNLTGVAGVDLVSGMAAMGGAAEIDRFALVSVLAGWIVVPLSAAALFFRRREI
jgi:Cu-processing system permease protein